MAASPTVKDIALAAGVSIGTVDRVLHERGRVSADTKERVRAAVSRLGFRPNPIARQLKRNRAYRFAVLAPRPSDDGGYWASADVGVAASAREFAAYGVRVERLAFARGDRASFRVAAARLADDAPDALLIAPVMPDEARSLLARIGGSLPYAFFDADLPGMAPVAAVGQDPYRSGFLAGRLLALASGEGALAVAATHSEDFHIRRRIAGCLDYFRAAGRPEPIVTEGLDFAAPGAAREWLDELESRSGGPAGVFVPNSWVHALAAAIDARHSDGGRPPALVGYDLIAANRRWLEAGRISCLISQRPAAQAEIGLRQLYRTAVLGGAAEPFDIPIHVYFKENLPSERTEEEI
jgi:LacI family transcriptional regulator